MKIDLTKSAAGTTNYLKALKVQARTQVLSLTLEYGIAVFFDEKLDLINGDFVDIYFIIDGHRFDNLLEVKRALNNKAFL